MQRLTKPYVYLVTAISVLCMSYFIINEPFILNLPVIIFIFITIYLQYNDSVVDDNFSFSMTSGSSIFMIMCFGIYPAIIAPSIGMILTSTVKYRDQFKIKDLEETGNKRVVKHEEIGIKTVFNISKEIIDASIILFLFLSLRINFMSQIDMWKVALVSAASDSVDLFMVFIAASFNTGRLINDIMFNRKTGIYIICNMVLSILLTYSYKNIGIFGALLVYLIALPLQRTTSLYYKIRNQEKELFVDDLTQSYNLRFLKDVLGNKLAKKEPFALIMIDLDSFKYINDTYGHLAGNKVLEEFSRIMRLKLIKDNYFCRYGGDEFIIVVNRRMEASILASEIVLCLRGYEFEYKENKIKLLLSLGIYENIDYEYDNVSSTIEKVDKAMYCAKSRGNNIIVNYRDIR